MKLAQRGGIGGRKLALAAWVLAACGAMAETPDRFVRYVEATGTQAVDVGVRGRYGTKIEAKLAWTRINTDSSFLDARGDATTDSRVYFTHCSSNGSISRGYGEYGWIMSWWGGKQFACHWESNRRYNVTVSFDVGRGAFQPEGETTAYDQVTNTIVINERTISNIVSTNMVDTGRNFYLFACNEGGTANYFARARCYALKIWQDDANDVRQLVRDFRPCVKDGRAGLYDAVSGTIFYSFTGTELVAPTDEPDCFLDSVIAHGDTYVDTGVIGRSGTRCEADMEWLKLGTGGDYAFLDVRGTYNADDRFFLIHTYSGKMNVGYGKFHNNVNGAREFSVGTRYTIASDLRAGSQTLVVNGETAYSSELSASYDTGRNLYLFANNRAGSVENCGYARLYSLKIWQTDPVTGTESLMRDFRPCMKDGEVALYDAVSEKIFFSGRKDLYAGGYEPTDEQPDHFVEYIQSPGMTFLDTKVRARSGLRMAGDFQWTQLRTRGEEDAYLEANQGDSDTLRMERTYLGATGDSGGTRFYAIHENDRGYWSGYDGQGLYKDWQETNYVETVTTNITETITTNVVEGLETVTTNVIETVTTNTEEVVSSRRWKFVENQRYSFDISYLVGSQTVDMNGERVIDASSSAQVDAGRDLYLFACNHDDRPGYSTPARCYGLTIWLDGEKVRDFKPCVKDGYAYLYDTVSKRLFCPTPSIPAAGNTGDRLPQVLTGEEKPDVYVEYVESDKTLFVDTGVIGRAGTTAEFEMQWLSGGDDTFLGSRTDNGNTRFFMWHWASSSMAYGYRLFRYPKDGDPTVVGANNEISQKVRAQRNYTYHVRSSLNAGSQVIEVNGTTIVNVADSLDLNTGYPLYIFACNLAGEAYYPSNARLYWLKLWQDGQLVRNFRPVRLDNNQAALWDSVTKEIYLPSKPFSAIGPRGEKVEMNRNSTIIIR